MQFYLTSASLSLGERQTNINDSPKLCFLEIIFQVLVAHIFSSFFDCWCWLSFSVGVGGGGVGLEQWNCSWRTKDHPWPQCHSDMGGGAWPPCLGLQNIGPSERGPPERQANSVKQNKNKISVFGSHIADTKLKK